MKNEKIMKKKEVCFLPSLLPTVPTYLPTYLPKVPTYLPTSGTLCIPGTYIYLHLPIYTYIYIHKILRTLL